MKVNYVFIDGREQECFIPADLPLSYVESLITGSEQGLIAIEVIGL